MSRSVSGIWAGILDSPSWRRFGRSPMGRRMLGSKPYQATNVARRYALTSMQCLRDNHRFDDVETVCVFIGHVKSGGSLLGALIDAHPDALVSDEIDLVRHVESGFRRRQLFHLIERGSRREMMKGRVTARRLDAYSLAVPDSSQGHADRPLVLGDTRAGPTTRRLGADPALLDLVEARLVPTRLRIIHVVREPFDPVSAMVRRGGRTVDEAIDDYSAQCARLVTLRSIIPADELLTVRYERLVNDPEHELTRVCEFVGLDPSPPTSTDYLALAGGLVDEGWPGEREQVEWDAMSVERVRRLMESTAFFGEGTDA